MPGKPIEIGPFIGGLNNISEAGAAEDNEVVDLVNFEVNLDKSLTSRPPMQILPESSLPSTNTIGWDILGIYRVTTAEWYLVVTVPTGPTNNTNTTVKAYLLGIVGVGETVLEIRNNTGLNNRVTSMVQFKDELYFCMNQGATENGFKWKKGDISSDIAAMPKGSVMISWKTRIWISGSGDSANGDRVYFSTINSSGPQPQLWGAQDSFDVAPGEGGFITAMIPSFSNLLIFKSDGTWRFSFPSGPEDGTVDRLSGQVGAANRYSVTEFENYIYVYDQGSVYELINSNYTQINRFVNFKESPFSVDSIAPDVELSVVNRRLILRYFNSVYIFTVDTKSWSQWFSYSGTPGRFQELPINSITSESSVYIAPSRGTTQSVSGNLIIDPNFADPVITKARTAVSGGRVDFSGRFVTLFHISGSDTRLYFNRTGSDSEYYIPVAGGQKFFMSYKVENITGTGNKSLRITYIKQDGSTTWQEIVATGPFTYENTFTVPEGCILGRVQLVIDNGSFKVTNVNFNRTEGNSPQNLIRLTDEYPDQSTVVEFIESWVETKSYDYQAAPAFKRMFFWGMDVKTPRLIIAEARPVSKVVPVTWSDLEKYTWDQLEQGTWDNPLSWVFASNTIVDITDPSVGISTNGRFFIKIMKSLRFRQISFYIKMTTLGNRATGPSKIFSLTTMVNPKQDVVDKAT